MSWWRVIWSSFYWLIRANTWSLHEEVSFSFILYFSERPSSRWDEKTQVAPTQLAVMHTNACVQATAAHTHTLVVLQRLCAPQWLEHIYLLSAFSPSHHHLPSLCSWRKGERSKYLYHYAAADGTEHKVVGGRGVQEECVSVIGVSV